jgi:hypothetical protein
LAASTVWAILKQSGIEPHQSASSRVGRSFCANRRRASWSATSSLSTRSSGSGSMSCSSSSWRPAACTWPGSRPTRTAAG